MDVAMGSQLLSLCIQHCPAPIAVLDNALRYLAVSRRWITDLRLESDPVGRSHFEVFPELPERWKEALTRCLRGAVERCEDDVFVRADGSVEFVRWEVRPWPADNGQIGGIVIFSEILTERKRVERELLQSEERLRLSIHGADLGTWHWDIQSGELVWSERCLAIFGIPAGTPMSYARFLEAIHPEDRERADLAVQRAIREHCDYDVEFRLGSSDRVGHWVAAKGRAFYDPDGRPVRMEGIIFDITPRKHAEEALRDSERRLRNALERLQVALHAAGMGTAVWEIPTDRMHWDDALLHLTGRTREEIERGGAAFAQSVVYAEDCDRVRRALADTLEHGTELQIEHRIVRPDGEIRWVARKSRLERDAEGKPLRMVGAIMDITARKRLEQEMLQAQRLDAVGHLAGGVAHDFNNILTIILGHTSLLQLRPDLDRSMARSIREITVAAERASRLTAQLLAFGRRQILQLRELDLCEAVQDASDMLERIVGENIACEMQACAPLYVSADPALLTQVLVNLAINAREAMPAGGRLTIRVSVEVLDSVQIAGIANARPGTWGCLAVTDTGRGIPPESLPRVFEPYFTTKSDAQGAGLGLSGVYGIVQQHHGFISVSSKLEQGTTFRVFLPVAQAPAQAKLPSAAGTVARGRGECVLLVEDEPALRSLMTEALESSGYTVVAAESGPAALQQWTRLREQVTLVFSDVRMPGGMSGIELAVRLRAAAPDLPVILTSGHGSHLSEDQQDVTAEKKAAFDVFLPKPYSVQTLLRTVREVLERRAAS